MTEEEIENSGVLTDSPYKSSCLAFIRQLNNINYRHEKAWRFVDQHDDGSLDEEAQGWLAPAMLSTSVDLYFTSNCCIVASY